MCGPAEVDGAAMPAAVWRLEAVVDDGGSRSDWSAAGAESSARGSCSESLAWLDPASVLSFFVKALLSAVLPLYATAAHTGFTCSRVQT